MRTLPSLTALRAFEAAARIGSFTLAARELGVSQAAMSYQIKKLESQLALTLFVRRNRRVTPTPECERLAKSISRAFDLMEQACNRSAAAASLSIITTISLANMWLIPRLGDFQARHPDIQLHVAGLTDLHAIETIEYDVAIWMGDGNWAPQSAEKLFDIVFTPMCSPSFLERLGRPLSVGDLPSLPLIAPDDQRWEVWFSQAGHPHLERARGLRIVYQNDVLAAARAGQGFGLGIPFFAAEDLKTGQLVRPFEQMSGDGTAYWLVYDKARRTDRRVVVFRRWLLETLHTESVS